jgi:hypothetical protein
MWLFILSNKKSFDPEQSYSPFLEKQKLKMVIGMEIEILMVTVTKSQVPLKTAHLKRHYL